VNCAWLLLLHATAA